METAVAHGYLSATVQGYAQKRERARGGKPAGKTMADLARDMGQYGFAHSGPSPDGPVN